ncbi:MAG: phenylacetate--CoA ligase [Clostridiales bacterium]|nr:phenylacetate--CoA ligase [Clostridiales bacterium]
MSYRYYESELETMPVSDIKDLQIERLKKQVAHVYSNVPYYKNLMDEISLKPSDIKGVNDLHKLPFTYKKDLRETYPYGLFAVPMRDVIRLHASSGTTGKQIVVGYTKEDLDVWDEIVARQLVAVGADVDDIIHVAYGYGLFTGGLGLHGGAQRLGASTIPVSSGNTKRQITILQDFGSTVLCCTPSYAAFLSETLYTMGLTKDDIHLKAGIFGAEAWTDQMRRDIEESLGIKAYDIYGLTEIMGPGVAYECSAQSGMHVNEDHFIIETIDPDTGEVLPEGSQGELVFSCITKQAFPLLRYRTRDIGVIFRETCSCGRTFIKMSKPRGRTDDMIIIRGVNVFPSQIEAVLMEHGYPSHYQIIVDRINNIDTMNVNVEMSLEQFSDTVRVLEGKEQELTDALKSLLGITARVHLVAPRTIVRSEGKAIRVIDNRKLF